MKRKYARRLVALCIAVMLAVTFAAVAVVQTLQLRDAHAEQQQLAGQIAALQQQVTGLQAQLTAEQAARAALEATASTQAAREEQLTKLADFRTTLADGTELGRVWVEDTVIDCTMYWGDTGSQFAKGAGVHSADGCVLPGENGTVFVGAHTDTFFNDLGSAQIGGLIHLETPWGNFSYRVTETKVIDQTEIDQCRWGATEPSCILYTCYPFGSTWHTNLRYLVYADPVASDEAGALPDDLAGVAAPQDPAAAG